MNTSENSMYYLSGRGLKGSSGLVCTTVGRQNCPPHGTYPVYTHPDLYNFTPTGRILDEYQFVYITQGGGEFESESYPRTEVSAGDLIVLFPGERHSYRPSRKTGWTEFWIGFKSGEDVTFPRTAPVLHIGIDERIVYIYETVIALAHFERKDTQKAMAGWIKALGGQVEYDLANRETLRRKHNQTVMNAQILLREHLHEHISPEQVAERLGVSYSLLREQFRATTGMSMATYSLQQRLNKSKSLLACSDKSVKEIAFLVGYDSISRFCCFFKEQTGITASEYRETSVKER